MLSAPSPLPKDKERSRILAKRTGAKPKECWLNSATAVMTGPMPVESYVYVEGFVILDCPYRIVIEHGWIQTDSAIIDITLPEDDLIYFPATMYSRIWLLEEFYRNGNDLDLPFNFGWRNPTYKAVYTIAIEHAAQLESVDA